MIKKFRIEMAIVVVASTVALAVAGGETAALARGGGGGGHGGGFAGGGFGGGGFGGGMRGGFGDDPGRAWGTGGMDRGFGDRGFGDRGFGGGSFGSDRFGGDRGIDDHPRASDADLRAGANQEYHWSSLPTDAGLGRGQTGAFRHSTEPVTGATLAARGQGVRNAFRNYDAFGRNFWNRYDRGWWYPWWGDYWPWGSTGWGDLAGFWDEPASDAPVEYDYGNNITYQDDSVYYGDQPMESTDAYYDQAQSLALSVPPTVPYTIPEVGTKSSTKSSTKAKSATSKSASAKASDWKPLGVFALTQGGQTDSDCIFQLAVDKSGTIRGNYYNPMTQEEKTVQGKVDKKNKRAAWTVGTNKTVVYDTGLANLLAQQSSILVHFGKSSTQQWNIVRIQRPQTQS